MTSGFLSDDSQKFDKIIRSSFPEDVNDAPKTPRPGLTAKGRKLAYGAAAVALAGGAMFGVNAYNQAQEASVEAARIHLDLKRAEMEHEVRMAELSAKAPKEKESEGSGPQVRSAAYSSPAPPPDVQVPVSASAVLGLAAVGGVVLLCRGKKKPA